MKSFGKWVWDWTKSIAVALVVWFFLRTFLIEAFRIPSGSMENTLLVGDFLFVNKLLYGAEVPILNKRLPAIREPRRGDILVFDSVEEAIKVVKRLVGLPGDTLSMENGKLYLNGKPAVEPWAIHTDPTANADAFQRERMRRWQLAHLVSGVRKETYHPDLNNWGPIVVPAGQYFMMGDNRDGSYDGRYWGFLPRENVRGRPLIVYYSFDGNTYKPLPFVTNIRWSRIFTTPE
ncbi:MAG: signal peptidase I [Gemmatimonadales bacterium]